MRDWLFLKSQGLKRRLGLPTVPDLVAQREVPPHQARDLSKTDLGDIFFSHSGRLIHKWAHYLDHYDRHFAKYRNTPVKMLEIGVSKGGSLEMWREYFGPQAVIYGIDVDPECASRVDAPNQVRIGSQDDPTFLR